MSPMLSNETVTLCSAPDGRPIMAQLIAPPEVSSLLSPVCNALGLKFGAKGATGTPLEAIGKEMMELWSRKRDFKLESPCGVVETRALRLSPRDLSGPTLLERLIPVSRPEFGGSATVFAPHTQTHPFACEEFVPSDLVLGLSKQEGSADNLIILKRKLDPYGWPSFEYLRSYLPETVVQLEGATLEVGETLELAKAWEVYERIGMVQVQVRMHVPRKTVGSILAGVALELARLHSKGQVHGDVKPSNVLITGKGTVLFDSLGIQPGMTSPGLSQGFAAPEQVLGTPVSFGTDQFALGMMLLRLVGGLAYGEETTFCLPTMEGTVIQHKLLRNALVFINPRGTTVDPSSIEEWKSLIQGCLRFEATERHGSMMSLMDQLRKLIDRGSLWGTLDMVMSFGRPVLLRSDAGDCPVWMLFESDAVAKQILANMASA